jgi:hypothetical protein
VTGPDFAHTPAALRARETKATALAARLRLEGVMPTDAAELAARDRTALARRAGLPARRPSDETWARALQLLAANPPVHADHRRPGCDCHPDERGVLYERPGWPCPHGPRIPTVSELLADPRDDARRAERERREHAVVAGLLHPPPPGDAPVVYEVHVAEHDQPTAILCTRDGRQPTPDDLAAVQAFGEFLRTKPTATRPPEEHEAWWDV